MFCNYTWTVPLNILMFPLLTCPCKTEAMDKSVLFLQEGAATRTVDTNISQQARFCLVREVDETAARKPNDCDIYDTIQKSLLY
jgi:hypothetical protein